MSTQPHSGSQANQAVFMATMAPGDTFMGMDLAAGGHLTHGKSVNQSGKWFRPVAYGVRQQDHLIDYDQAWEVARAEKPKVIIAGGSAYSRAIDFGQFRAIADEVDAVLMVDIAHYAGLVAGGAYPNPFPHAHIVTTTTHKTLRGPRGGMIMTNSKKWAKKIDSAVFPGLQGGPLMHVIAAKAVAFGEALRPEFKLYAHQVIENARALADSLQTAGFKIVSNGTDKPPDAGGPDAQGRQRRRCGGRPGAGRDHHQQERYPLRPASADADLGPASGLAGRYDARFWPRGIPPGGRLDRRGSGWNRGRRGQFGRRGQGPRRGPGHDGALSYLQRIGFDGPKGARSCAVRSAVTPRAR